MFVLRHIPVVAALAVAAGAVPLTAAHAATGDTYAAVVIEGSKPTPNVLCATALTSDPTAEMGTVTGVLSGGPVRVSGGTTLTCRLQDGVSDHTGHGPEINGHGSTVVTAGPSGANIVTSGSIYLCVTVNDEATSVTSYWDASTSSWSTSATAKCTLVPRRL
jgi:hypothetical protein